MQYIDCHTHSKNSIDGSSTLEEMLNEACKHNLAAYAVTEHCEVNRWFSQDNYNENPPLYDVYDYNKYFEKSVSDNAIMKEKYAGKLKVLNGIELGQTYFDLELSAEVVKDERLDFVIGSAHQLKGEDDFCFIDYSKANGPELLTKYYSEIYKMSKWSGFDSLGHLTYPLRYITGENGVSVDMKPYEELIRESFKEIIAHGKGIEINTSGFRQKYGKPFPHYEYVKMYKDLGGEIITIGSDAHCTADLGKNLKEGTELAKEAGFKYIVYFEKRKPVFLKID